MPRPPTDDRSEDYFYTISDDGKYPAPPPSYANVSVKDRGCAGPRHMRMTLNTVPVSSDVLASSNMPLALLVQPLAPTRPQDDRIPVVDFGPAGPPRCGRCKAYVCPFFRFIHGGKSFVCCFCSALTEVAQEYFCHLGTDGRRRDVGERPELTRGSIDIVAPPAYCIREPMEPAHVFLIDTSPAAVQSGLTQGICDAILAALPALGRSKRTRIGIATHDRHVAFFQVPERLQDGSQPSPQMLVMPDLTEPYAPAAYETLVPFKPREQAVRQLLKDLPGLFGAGQGGSAGQYAQQRPQDAPQTPSCGLAAVRACIEQLRPLGGKVHAFMSQLPTEGALALAVRGDACNRPPESESEALSVLHPAHKSEVERVAADAAAAQVSIDLVLCPRPGTYMDVATLSVLPRLTSGSTTHIPSWAPPSGQQQLAATIRAALARPAGLEAILRVRTSQGISVEDYYGSFFRSTPQDCDLPHVGPDSSVIVALRHDERLKDSSHVFLQAALLYTTPEGQRRVRVHTLARPTSAALGHVFRTADTDAQVAVLKRRVLMQLPGRSLANVRLHVTRHVVSVLHAYRKYCATSTSMAQLILPEGLKLLPLYANALLKSPALRQDATPDVRAAAVAAAMAEGPAAASSTVYPAMYRIDTLRETAPWLFDGFEEDAEGAENGGESPRGGFRVFGGIRMPPRMRLSSELIESDGVYLLEDGFDAVLHFGVSSQPEVVSELLGHEGYLAIRDKTPAAAKLSLAVTRQNTPLSRALWAVVEEIENRRQRPLRMRVLRPGEARESEFYNRLVEDRTASGTSYVDYLCGVHRQIQNLM
ncbi:unnamed protein product [Pedinophyceae sp. YPF-701]|nr:unnamed protein product [Pedinophyceae sp. YPF-701]